MRVFKYEIKAVDEPKMRLPFGALILSVGAQGGKMFLWALVNPSEQRTKQHVFRVAGSGHEIADVQKLRFIGTVHMHSGSLHVFERISEI